MARPPISLMLAVLVLGLCVLGGLYIYLERVSPVADEPFSPKVETAYPLPAKHAVMRGPAVLRRP